MTSKKLFEQRDYSIIRVSGSDSAKFLQGQLSCDVDKISQNQASLGGYSNVQGRLFAVFYLLKEQDDFLILLPTSVAETTLQRLSMFAVFFQAELSIDESYRYFALENDELDNSYRTHITEKFNSLSIEGVDLYLIKAGVKPEDIFPNSTAGDQDIWRLAQINAGIPMVYLQTIEKLLPHYIGLADETVRGVSFDKGCYTGQEVIARMHYRGTLKTHPLQILINTEVALTAGQPVKNQSEKKVGELIDSIIVDGKTHCLISLADKALEDGLQIEGQPLHKL